MSAQHPQIRALLSRLWQKCRSHADVVEAMKLARIVL